MKPRRRTRHLVAEALEARLALASLLINTPGNSLDADPGDGVWDVDLATPGLQVTFAAAVAVANAEANSVLTFDIDGTFSGATFNLPVTIDGNQHNVNLAGGTWRFTVGGTVKNVKLAQGTLDITGSNTQIENNTITAPANPVAVKLTGHSGTFKNNTVDGGHVQQFGNDKIIENNTITQGGVVLSGHNNQLRNNLILQGPDYGVVIRGNSNLVSNNNIGANNNQDLGHTLDGVLIDGQLVPSANNTISNNLISGNGGHGVFIRGAQASANKVQGNRIGTNDNGTAAIANAYSGVRIDNSSGNIIGGNVSSLSNLIAGNAHSGVEITGATSDGNSLLGNLIGLQANGAAKLPNGNDGITISSAINTVIGSSPPGSGNMIAGNSRHGIAIVAGAKGTKISGNLIGTNAADTGNIGNVGDGVHIFDATENLVDGIVSPNRISGNAGSGVYITGPGATKNEVRSSLIGLKGNNQPLPNAQGGVTIADGASQNIVGGMPAARNVISGNGLWGVAILAANDNTVSGNSIGTNTNSTAAAGSQPVGVLIAEGAKNNRIGIVLNVGSANLISGHTSHGVEIRDAGTSNNILAGNSIGVNAGATGAIPNGGYGVYVHNQASQNQIGVALAQQAQVIASNKLGGVAIANGAEQNIVQQNLIGFLPNTAQGFAVSGNGVLLDNASNNLIGDPTGAFGNYLHYMQQAGVRVQNGATGNRILGNSLANNGGLGISLDTALAQLPRQVVIREVEPNGSGVRLFAELLGTPNTTVRVDVYGNNVADPSGFGEGATPLSFVSVTIPASGFAQFQVNLATVPGGTQYFAMAQTDANQTTYELSRAAHLNWIESWFSNFTVSTVTNDVEPIQITATLAAASGNPTGNVAFYDGNTYLGTAAIDPLKQAKLTITLPQGARSITAIYLGSGTGPNALAGAIAPPLTINVVPGPPNVPPVANSDVASVTEDQVVVIPVLANDTDPDGGTIAPATVVIVQAPTHGVAVVNPATGEITYTPYSNYDGGDVLHYTITDNRNGTSNIGVVTITVVDVPEPHHNKIKPLDVDKNGVISPTDIAHAIALLNVLGVGLLAPPGAPPAVLPDVDGDNYLTPTDVALLITAVNSGAAGEAPASVSADPDTADLATATAETTRLDLPISSTWSASDNAEPEALLLATKLTRFADQAALAALWYAPTPTSTVLPATPDQEGAEEAAEPSVLDAFWATWAD